MRKYKDSGSSWVGRIPIDWKMLRGKNLFVQKSDKGNSKALVLLSPTQNYGVIPQDLYEELSGFTAVKLNENIDYNLLKTVHKGAYVISLRSFQGGFEYSEYEGVVSPAYQVFYPIAQICDRYYKYLFKDKSFVGKMNSYTMSLRDGKTIAFDDFSRTYIPFPPVEEQERIAFYLDAKCAEVDDLSVNIQCEIDTLEAYKRSVITETVTKGLGKSAPVKDSGIPWIGMIPEHWKASKIKYEIFPVEKRTTERDGIITCFRDGEVTLRSKRREEGFTVSLTEHGYHGVDIGDLVIHGMDAFAGAIGCSDSRGKTTPVVHVCKTTGNNRFFMYCLRSMAYGNILMDLSDGIRVRSSDFRNFSKLGVFGIAVAPVQEQNEIVAYLDKICSEIESIIAQKQEQLAVLADYKKSVIYEYVTGKKEAPVI